MIYFTGTTQKFLLRFVKIKFDLNEFTHGNIFFWVLVKLRGVSLQDGNTTFPPILLFHLNKTGTQAEARISFTLLIAGMDLGFGRLFITFIPLGF
jgi:hypothetical protein